MNRVSHCLIVKLHEIDPKTQRRRNERGLENLVKQFEPGDLRIISFVCERFEGRLPASRLQNQPAMKVLSRPKSSQPLVPFPRAYLATASTEAPPVGQTPQPPQKASNPVR
jgi:hypothetical protein